MVLELNSDPAVGALLKLECRLYSNKETKKATWVSASPLMKELPPSYILFFYEQVFKLFVDPGS